MSDKPANRIALDVHAHLAPIVADRLAGLDGAAWEPSAMRLVLDGHAIGPQPLFQPAALIEWMDDNGVERAWISIPPPLYRQRLAPPQARLWAEYVNAGLATICDAQVDRLAPLHHLPIEHPELAQEIAITWIARGATRFAAAAGGAHVRVLSDAVYRGLWEALDGQGCFLFLHPARCADGRLAAFYLENLLGNPHETAVAAAHLIFGGVCRRYPRIRFCLAHGGGTTAVIAGRWQRGFETGRPGIDVASSGPREMLRRMFVDCITHDAKALTLAAEIFGADHVVFGSDWPFPMGLLAPQAQLADLSPDMKQAILRTTGDRLRCHWDSRRLVSSRNLGPV
jgi:aminocarboxymuconate-semialdehyde decarboxylase